MDRPRESQPGESQFSDSSLFSSSHTHFNADSNFNSSGGKRKSNKFGQDEILVSEEKFFFPQNIEQIRIPIEVLGIEDLEAIGSFSVSMNVTIGTRLQTLKTEQTFFQIGASPSHRILVIGITKDKTFFVSCTTQKGKVEKCYTQCKVKNSEYNIVVSVADEGTFTEITIFINGRNEASLVFPAAIESLQGTLMLGNDAAPEAFQGSISDLLFYIKALEAGDIKDCYVTKQSSPGNKSMYQIRQEKKVFLNTTERFSKKKGLPVNLVRTHNSEKGFLKPREIEEQKEEKSKNGHGDNKDNGKIHLYSLIEDMKDYLYQSEKLFTQAKELGTNFEWAFNLSSVLSPVIEEQGTAAKYDFKCLHTSLCESEARFYPCYAITVSQFMNVIGKTDSKLKVEDVIGMAEVVDCLDFSQEFGQFIYYDKLLIAVRNATLSKEEMFALEKSYDEDVEKHVILSGVPSPGPKGEKMVRTLTGYNLIPIFENADAFDQKDFIEANPDAKLAKIIVSLDKPTSHVKFIHFTYKLKTGKLHSFEVGRPVLSGQQDLVHFTIDINDDEFLTGVKVSNFHMNNGNRVVNHLSFALNTHPNGIVYEPFVGHPSELKAVIIDPADYQEKRILGFYGAFRDDLVGLGVYLEEIVPAKSEIEEPPVHEEENVLNQEDDEEYILTLPQLKQEWNEGRFQVFINRCANCNEHRNTTNHHEADFCKKFNDWGDRIKEYFPNVEVVGNYDRPRVYGIFEVYIRGVGPVADRDDQGRIFLYQNYTTPTMKTNFRDVHEALVQFCFEYGDSVEMAKAQDKFTQKYAKELPKKWTGAHGHPVDIPEKVSQSQGKRNKNKGKIEDDTPVICKHWGCGEEYKFDSMNETVCQYHPGRYEFGSVNGLWPEGWTCCRGEWEKEGCKKGRHAPVPITQHYQLCINRGALNPKYERPDSVCGKAFQDASDECKFHEGHLVGRGASAKWTCCGEVGENAPPCNSTVHASVKWPDEQAKLYFVTSELRNPGIYRNDRNQTLYSNRAATCGIYKKTVPYTAYENPVRRKMKEMEETENEDRVCFNWGCGRAYKEVNNKKIKTCKCHPGRWDFGYTGITVSKATTEFLRTDSEVLLWKPHWTCCRQDWAVPGCTMSFHHGPLVTEAVEPKYKWPNEDAQKYFRKTISPLWKTKLEGRYALERPQVAQKYDDCAKSVGSGGKISISSLPQLCDKLKLHLLIISEDLSHHLRFLQVVNHTAEPLLDDGSGYIDKQKFLDWWFANLAE